MLLDQAQCLAYCETPAATADLAVGRALEQRHALHVDGERPALLAWLATQKPELASPEAFGTLEKVAVAATKSVYAGITNLVSKVFTAQGRNFYFDFTRPELSVEFDAYLKDTKRTGQSFYNTFRNVWLRAAQVGFQGVFLIDLPARADAASEPAPFCTYIPSSGIHDVRLSGDRIEYLILATGGPQTGDMLYYCYDDQQCHQVLLRSGSYFYLTDQATTHGMGYVPACPVTTRQPDPLRPTRRTSYLAASLEDATIYLRDKNMHEMMKAYHGYAKMWSYGVRCDAMPELSLEQIANQCVATSCNATGWVSVEGVRSRCGTCQGKGRYIPVGPDKVYIVEPAPQGETSVVDPGPAGYITPELDSAKYIGEQCVLNEAKIEKAVLGKSGLLDQQKQDTLGGKILDWGPAYDRFANVAEDAEAALKFILDTKARYRYGSDFRESAITLGRKYLAKSLDQMEGEYAAAKEAGLDDALLYSYLEDIIYTKWAGDPMELERNLLKLELTPVPTQTVDEAATAGVLSRKTLLLKSNINDYFNRFERENGSILDFASLLSHGEKVNRILQQFTIYLNDDLKEPGFASATRAGATIQAGGGTNPGTGLADALGNAA